MYIRSDVIKCGCRGSTDVSRLGKLNSSVINMVVRRRKKRLSTQSRFLEDVSSTSCHNSHFVAQTRPVVISGTRPFYVVLFNDMAVCNTMTIENSNNASSTQPSSIEKLSTTISHSTHQTSLSVSD